MSSSILSRGLRTGAARASLVFVTAGLSACGSGGDGAKSDDDYRRDVVTGMHDALLEDLDALVTATEELEAAAPLPLGRGWDRTEDADALARMKAAWVRARAAYEHVEGALAPIFPDVDASIDARYDDFLAELAPNGDADPFDDRGVTGLHAVERILYLDTTPPHVVDFEKALPGYAPAAFPANEAQAASFKNLLAGKLVADARVLRDQWTPQKIDLGGAFQGLIALMNEQREKVNKAGSNEEESRYSQRTLADLRDNLEGTRKIYALFRPWLASKKGGAASVDGAIERGFAGLADLYATVPGDAIPEPPVTWSAEAPTASDLATPFGKLYVGVRAAVDPRASGSIVSEMNLAAGVLGFSEFVEAP